MSSFAVEHITTWSELSLAIVGVLTTAWIGMKKLYRMARNIETLVQTTEQNSTRLVQIEAQVKTNGGTSLRDAVNRIEQATLGIEDRVSVLEHLPCHLRLEADRVEGE